ncbi:MAG TPA: M56 family metallopeptidase [Candidatus Angelobacter sp.]|nr:M56 family metallopeptidase [Candidatus Angelobacter sp.]
MMSALHVGEFASAVVETLVYALAEGSMMAVLVWLLLRLIPGRNSGTRFAIWLATLAAMALLPLFSQWPAGSTAGTQPAHSITISTSIALWITCGWAALASLGLMRVALGLWQLRRLRNSCVDVPLATLAPESQKLLADFSRPVSLCVSAQVEVPTALGFFRPAIVLPTWLLKQVSAQELEHILLHELAHLRRRDDWTNLAQKVLKAVLFFHPLAWWIEHKLSLDREMACDDAVLAQTSSPGDYARCLAHLAEKSFLRRQVALAQAAVSRVRQLSLRLEQILRADRPATTSIWKPAIPLVTALAVLCTFWAAHTPRLVSFTDDSTAAPTIATHGTSAQSATFVPSTLPAGYQVQQASLKTTSASGSARKLLRTHVRPRHVSKPPTQMAAARPEPNFVNNPVLLDAAYIAAQGHYVVSYEKLVFRSADPASPAIQSSSLQILVWQVRYVTPAPKTNPQT